MKQVGRRIVNHVSHAAHSLTRFLHKAGARQILRAGPARRQRTAPMDPSIQAARRLTLPLAAVSVTIRGKPYRRWYMRQRSTSTEAGAYGMS